MFDQAIEKLCKWRSVFAGWQLGTRTKNDPECAAVRDHRELSMMLRIETTAMVGLMIKKGIITVEEFQAELAVEADALDRSYEQKFPGFSTTPIGVSMDVSKAGETMRRMNFKP